MSGTGEVGVTMAPSGQQWTISSGPHEAVLVEVGGGLRGYRVAGVDVVDGYTEHEMCPASAGQVLAPWPNRIRDGRYVFDGEAYQLALTEPVRHNAIHGLVAWVRWELVGATADSVTLGHDLPPQPGYPWPLRLRVTWTVSADGLHASNAVTNLSADPCPFGFSAHPYLRVPEVAIDDLTLHVPAGSRLLTDGRSLPIGAARVAGSEFDYRQPRRIGPAMLDTAFGDLSRDTVDGRTAVRLSAVDGRGVRVWADAGFTWWQVFTADTLPGPRYRRSVAIEPMTCPPDAFRSGRDLIVLAPGQTWTGDWGITPLG
ncbi:MAG TPA: aldose 1-epimerase family protein [Micromonosporaceae bacterium]